MQPFRASLWIDGGKETDDEAISSNKFSHIHVLYSFVFNDESFFERRLILQLNVAVAISFATAGIYLNMLIGILVSLTCLGMLCVAIEAPSPVVTRLENSKVFESLFTFRGRYIVDLLVSLFLFGMSVWGIVMAVLTLFLIFGIRFLGVKQPDAFNEIFRQSDIESHSMGDSYTMEGTYDTEGTER
mmetsp:Transcript_30723/g.64453  ORF Transcript_30723/g.64453 Transcript_30723/m.64453 type:complete len:186 (-) Transcript_30723:811-1368(-)